MREQYIYIYICSLARIIVKNFVHLRPFIFLLQILFVGVYLVFLKGATLVESMFSLYHDDPLP